MPSSLVRCEECGYENFPQHRFCGMCGAGLRLPGSSSPAPVSAFRAAQPAQENVKRPVNAPPKDMPEALNTPRADIRIQEELPAPRVRRSSEADNIRSVMNRSSVGAMQDSGRPVSGTSLLSQEAERETTPTYLLEDDTPRHRGLYLFLVLLLVLIGIVLWNRRQDLSALVQGYLGPKPVNQASTTPPAENSAVATNAPNPAQTNAAPQAANPPNSPAANPPQPVAPPSGVSNAVGKSVDDSTQKQEVADSNPPSSEKSDKVADTKEPESPAQAQDAFSTDDAMEAEGEKYLYGDGVRQNCNLAQEDLLTAAQGNNAKAQSVLGTMYATGHCVGRDLPLAYHWFARASQQEPRNRRVEQDLRLVWNQMTPAERQLALRASH